MNKIHKLVASLVKPNLLVKVLVGMAIAAIAIYLLKPTDEEIRNLIGIIGYSTVAMMPVTWIFMMIFYADRKDVYRSPVE